MGDKITMDTDVLRDVCAKLNGAIGELDPGAPIDEIAGPVLNQKGNGSVSDRGSREVQYRFAKESIGIACVELNRAYDEFVIDGEGYEVPSGRIQRAHEHLSAAMAHLDVLRPRTVDEPDEDDDWPACLR